VTEIQGSTRQIGYRYKNRPQGGAARIETKDARSLDAVRALPRYQIAEHHTGDQRCTSADEFRIKKSAA